MTDVFKLGYTKDLGANLAGTALDKKLNNIKYLEFSDLATSDENSVLAFVQKNLTD